MRDVLDQKELIWPAIKALQVLGGKAHASTAMYDKVVELEEFGDEITTLPLPPNHKSKLKHRLGLAGLRARNLGLLEKQSGIWVLTDMGKDAREDDIDEKIKTDSQITDYHLKNPNWLYKRRKS